MTLPADRIGDKGQPYQVEAEGYPDDGWNVIGWAETRDVAADMASSISLAPSCTKVRVVCRKGGHVKERSSD